MVPLIPASQEVAPPLTEMFAEAMTRLVSGVAVVTARRSDGKPCGLLVSSICSYSVRPPSVLVAIDAATRSHATLVECAEFGVHLLGRGHDQLAAGFAGRGDDKFAGLDWDWDGTVPRLRAVPIYLLCATDRVFHHGDHAILVGAATSVDVDVRPAEPLVYYRRRLDWRLHVSDQAAHCRP